MRMRHAAVVAGLALGLIAGTAAQAAYIVDVNQVGTDVVFTGNGSIDLSGSTFRGNSHYTPSINPYNESLTIGGGDVTAYRTSFTGSNFFATKGANANTTSGLPFGFELSDNLLIVPRGYLSNTVVGPTIDTYQNRSLADLGLTAGTSFTYYFPTAGAESLPDTFTVNVLGSVSAVPLPSSAPMFGAALLALGAVGYGLKRKGKAAA